MHIRGGKSDIFGSAYCQKVIFLGLNKTETISSIFFDTKHRLTDISWLTRGNPDLYLQDCFSISYVHVQVSKYKIS